jgi:hypothetical protein
MKEGSREGRKGRMKKRRQGERGCVTGGGKIFFSFLPEGQLGVTGCHTQAKTSSLPCRPPPSQKKFRPAALRPRRPGALPAADPPQLSEFLGALPTLAKKEPPAAGLETEKGWDKAGLVGIFSCSSNVKAEISGGQQGPHHSPQRRGEEGREMGF